MIERLLAAENALDRGDVDTAGIVFTQVAQADPKNVIAIVGLARVALREDRIEDARDLAMEALELDPHEAAAQKILREVLAELPPPPDERAPTPEPAHTPEPADAPEPAHHTEPASAVVAPPPQEPSLTPEPAVTPVQTVMPHPAPAPRPEARPARRRAALLQRLRRWLLGRRD